MLSVCVSQMTRVQTASVQRFQYELRIWLERQSCAGGFIEQRAGIEVQFKQITGGNAGKDTGYFYQW